MSRKMISPEQLEKTIDDKLKGYDESIPTDIGGVGDELWLFHDGNELKPQKKLHLRQIFGKWSLIGDGNIDLYIHHLKLTNSAGAVIAIDFLSSSNLQVDSIQDLNTLLGSVEKTIVCSSGYIDWKGSFAKTAGITAYTTIKDVMEAI